MYSLLKTFHVSIAFSLHFMTPPKDCSRRFEVSLPIYFHRSFKMLFVYSTNSSGVSQSRLCWCDDLFPMMLCCFRPDFNGQISRQKTDNQFFNGQSFYEKNETTINLINHNVQVALQHGARKA